MRLFITTWTRRFGESGEMRRLGGRLICSMLSFVLCPLCLVILFAEKRDKAQNTKNKAQLLWLHTNSSLSGKFKLHNRKFGISSSILINGPGGGGALRKSNSSKKGTQTTWAP